MAVIASVLLLPSTRVAFQVRIGAIVGLIWALLCIWVAALAFQAKLELQAPKDSPRAVLWWSAHWIRVVLITIAITVAWLLVLVVFTNLHG
jgi:heme/copper-type cytochrome/quinol oxidase subunit 2